MIGYTLYNFSNYIFPQVQIIQMTSLIHHSIYLLGQEQECVTHINTRSLHALPVHNWVVTTPDVLTHPVPHLGLWIQHLYMHTHTHAHTHYPLAHTCTHTRAHMYTHMHAHTCTNTCMHTYTHITHTCTKHMHTHYTHAHTYA